MKTYFFEFPLFVDIPKKTKKDERYWLNLNKYRNTQHFKLNAVKSLFHEYAAPQMKPLEPFSRPVMIHYDIHFHSNGRADTGNYSSVVSKFFEDALVEHGLIEDDTKDDILFTSYAPCGVVPKTGKVRIMVSEDIPMFFEVISKAFNHNNCDKSKKVN